MRRRLTALLALTLPAVALAPMPAARAALPGVTERWHKSAPGGYFYWSSPSIGDVNGDGSNDVVVGGLDGKVYAYDAAGNLLPGWPAAATAPVASSPAIADVDGDGKNEVITGVGNSDTDRGAINVFGGNGARRCVLLANTNKEASAVINSPAIGDVNGDGINDIVYGSKDNKIRVVSGSCGEMASFDNTDSIFSAPALSDIDSDGAAEIFIGGDATRGPAGQSLNGGYFRALRWQAGATGANGDYNLKQIWERTSTEAFQSAAAIGDIDGDGRKEVVTGSGAFYCRWKNICGDSNKVWAFHLDDGSNVPGWPKTATFNTTFQAAPALGDIDGDGRSDVVVLTNGYTANGGLAGGAVDAFLSTGGKRTFRPNDLEMFSGPVIADLNGDGSNEIVVSTTTETVVLDGTMNVIQSGLATKDAILAHKAAPAVGLLGSKWALVSTGFAPGAGNDGHIYAYDITTPKAAPWPMYQKNALRAGAEAIVPIPITCDSGYWLTASDGGVFSYGDAAFYGSTGAIRLSQPIVGMAALKTGRGYRFVASDGGIFSFGEAKFFGSTGDRKLNSPIVGMATTPSGNGYWLVAADGGIFSFGDAKFYGSTGGLKLNQPIVGMAATPTGNGYWFVAADGGIFSFGDAKFYGSTGGMKLNSPIVGMAASKTGNGYWFVAADGGIFSFGGAKFYGSTGALKLNSAIVGMKASRSGDGYWFVAKDGGIFSFGDAQFCGSAGRQKLNFPIVGIA